MIRREPRQRPLPWAAVRADFRPRWAVPFLAFEWVWAWAAFYLGRWSFLEALEYLGQFSVLVAVIFYYSESGNRVKQRHYQAWQVINTAQGKGGSGGRIEALQELNADHVALVGVDVSSAFLQGVQLERASLVRAEMSAADMRGSDLRSADLSYADLHSANLRGSVLRNAVFANTNLRDTDLWGSDLTGAKLKNADLESCDLRYADLANLEWSGLKSVRMANIAGVKHAPAGFVQWALRNGAVQAETGQD